MKRWGSNRTSGLLVPPQPPQISGVCDLAEKFGGSSHRCHPVRGALRPKLMSGSRPGGVLPGALKLVMTPDHLLKSAATNVNKIKAT